MLVTVEDYRPLVSNCTRRLNIDPQTIEDIAQEAMIKIHLHLAQLSEEERSRREDLDRFIGRMVRNLVLDQLRARQSFSKTVRLSKAGDLDTERVAGHEDQFRDLALKYSAAELLRVLPEYEASLLSLLLNPSEQFKDFWRRRQKIREFWAARYGSRYAQTEPLDLEDTALPEFLMISTQRYRRAVAKIQRVARMILARERVGYERFKSYLNRINCREECPTMPTILADPIKPITQDAPECFGILYEPLVIQCRTICTFKYLCKDAVKETIQRIGPDEFQKEVVRIWGVNAADTSPKVLEVQEIFVRLGLEVVHCAQSVNAKLMGYNVFIISRKKSSDLRGMVRFPQVRGLEGLPPQVSAYLALGEDGKTWSSTASDLDTLEGVLMHYVKFFRENI